MSEEVKKEQNEQEETLYCECCGCLIDDDDYTEWNGQIICSDCLENHTTTCECCGERIWDEDVYGDNDITLCSHCYHHSYTRCSCCDALLHEDDAYYLDGETYCRDCYEDEREESNLIHEYGYKPNPIFYGEGNRYFGIELEIDGAGRDDDFAEELLDIANAHADLLYIKTDGSLDDGMELVSHPCTMEYHHFSRQTAGQTNLPPLHHGISHQRIPVGRYYAPCNPSRLPFASDKHLRLASSREPQRLFRQPGRTGRGDLQNPVFCRASLE